MLFDDFINASLRLQPPLLAKEPTSTPQVETTIPWHKQGNCCPNPNCGNNNYPFIHEGYPPYICSNCLKDSKGLPDMDEKKGLSPTNEEENCPFDEGTNAIYSTCYNWDCSRNHQSTSKTLCLGCSALQATYPEAIKGISVLHEQMNDPVEQDSNWKLCKHPNCDNNPFNQVLSCGHICTQCLSKDTVRVSDANKGTPCTKYCSENPSWSHYTSAPTCLECRVNANV